MKQKASSELIRLRGETWEAWEFPDEAGRPTVFLGAAADRTAATKDRILAVPARLVMAAPVWVDSTDPDIVKTSVDLELEVRGWIPRKKSADAICTRKLTADGKTLVICAIFPAEAPEPYAGKVFARYEASPFLVEPIKDGVALWREGDNLTAVFARGSQVVYWATLDWPAGSQQVRQWLKMVVLHLTATSVLAAPPSRVVLDEMLGKEDLDGLIPGVRQETSSFPPSLKSAGFEWKPDSARQIERKADSTRKTRQVALALAAIYLVFALAAGLHLAWLGWKSRQLENQIGQLEASAGEFQPAVRDWRLVGPGAETDYFPLEILHRVVRNMPPGGIRLTMYDTAEGRVTIEGEATSASLASQFFAAVSKDVDLQRMNWQMPTPALLPSSAARFQLSGVVP